MKASSSSEEVPWPFPERRNPPLESPDYLGSRGLSLAVQRAIEQTIAGQHTLDIVDVGCGKKPFYPFFQPFARSYIGTDIIADDLFVDRICAAERLGLDNDCADVVLCLSVLEHTDDPIQAVKELHRIVRRDGVVLASTHGAFVWHPYPQDHWRWTHTGLRLLFQRDGGFSSLEMFATRGSFSGQFSFLAHQVYAWTSRTPRRLFLRKPLVKAVNRIGTFIDRKTPGQKDLERHATLIPEYFVIARK